VERRSIPGRFAGRVEAGLSDAGLIGAGTLTAGDDGLALAASRERNALPRVLGLFTALLALGATLAVSVALDFFAFRRSGVLILSLCTAALLIGYFSGREAARRRFGLVPHAHQVPWAALVEVIAYGPGIALRWRDAAGEHATRFVADQATQAELLALLDRERSAVRSGSA
jgi:hypothetical protein